jgi:hypothetical protein
MSAPASERHRQVRSRLSLAVRALLGAAALLPALLPAEPVDTLQAVPAVIPAATLAPSAEPPLLELQVFANRLAVYDAPRPDATVIAEIPRGEVLQSAEQRGAWYRIAMAGAAGSSGWVRLESGEYGEPTFSVATARAGSAIAPEDAAEADLIRRGPADARRRLAYGLPQIDPGKVAPPLATLPRESVPVPDRWRIMQALDFKFPFYDPYNQNVLKGDLPVLQGIAPDIFFTLGLISDTTLEVRGVPTPVGAQTTGQAGRLNIYGDIDQSTFVENLIVSLGLVQGNTTFKPPDYELRVVPVFNYNRTRVEEERALRIDPRRGVERSDKFVGMQELFIDKHLRNVSERYDFDSLRLGIQPLQLDFRGFLFQDNALALRLFGNRDNNKWQYNLGWARRIEKDTNSGLNDLSQDLRDDDVFFFNVYRQDFPRLGFTSQLVVVHNENREEAADYYDDNGFLVRPAVIGDVRPHDYRVSYLGYNGDGHLGRYGLTASAYLALGEDERHPLAQRAQDIQAFFTAAELSRDFDWIRVRGNFLYASGDKDPFNDTAGGFDAILENPQFAGADTSFFIRQAVPLVGGGGVALSGRNGVLPSLRSSKDKGQSNFVNPGLTLLGVGADFDVLPTLRLLGNLSYLRFNETEVLGVLRNQAPPDKELGIDISAGLQYRPLYSQNIVITASFAALLPGKGLDELYADNKTLPLYSGLLNVILAY